MEYNKDSLNIEKYSMRKLIYPLAFLLILAFIEANAQQNEPDLAVKLFYLGGQSNMDGFGYTEELPDSLNKRFENVWIFHGNPIGDEEEGGGVGQWKQLQPGHGMGFIVEGTQNKLSDRFGIELSFAHKIQHLYPNERIAIIKYSRGGTSIDSLAAGRFGSWEPDYQGSNGINQYDHFLKTVRLAMKQKDIDGDGIEDELIPSGILWMQGESDGVFTEEIAVKYYDNLKRLMDLIRATLRKDDLPVIIGKISDSNNDTDGKVWDYGELVQYAQEKYARNDPHAAIVRSTKHYQYSDKWHYDSKGFIDLGVQFALAYYGLVERIKNVN